MILTEQSETAVSIRQLANKPVQVEHTAQSIRSLIEYSRVVLIQWILNIADDRFQ